MDAFEIREARREDCAAIRQLLQELAEYEKMPDEVRITEKELIADGFGDDKFYHALMVEQKNVDSKADRTVGYALYFYTYSTWDGRAAQLEDIYVREKYRKLGVGTELIKRVAQTIRKKGCKRLDLHILDWNAPTMDFYKNLGGCDLTAKEGWNLVRFDEDALGKICKD